MLDRTFVRDLGKQPALTAADIDLSNDRILVVDISEPSRSQMKQMSPAELGKALKRNEAQALAVPLITCRTSTGLALTATPGAGVFGISLTPGTSHVLTGETATSNTKTDLVVAEVVLPANYVDGDAVSLVVNAHETGTATVKTVDASVYKVAADGTHGADICATAIQNITTTAADKTFTVTPTGLVAGDRLVVLLTMVITEAAAATAIGQINSIRLTF